MDDTIVFFIFESYNPGHSFMKKAFPHVEVVLNAKEPQNFKGRTASMGKVHDETENLLEFWIGHTASLTSQLLQNYEPYISLKRKNPLVAVFKSWYQYLSKRLSHTFHTTEVCVGQLVSQSMGNCRINPNFKSSVYMCFEIYFLYLCFSYYSTILLGRNWYTTANTRKP